MSPKHVRDIPIAKIISRKQVRDIFDETHLGEMAATIRIHGVLQPIYVQVHGDEYLLIAGEGRVRASKIAGKTTIPAVVDERELKPVEVLEIQLIENIQRAELTPTETARSIDELMKMCWLFDDTGRIEAGNVSGMGKQVSFAAQGARSHSHGGRVRGYPSGRGL